MRDRGGVWQDNAIDLLEQPLDSDAEFGKWPIEQAA